MKNLRLIFSIILAALAAILLAGPAGAIDCTKATTKNELAVCADPVLIAKDAELNAAYSAAYRAMPAKDRKFLVKSQQNWVIWFEDESQLRKLSPRVFDDRIAQLKRLKSAKRGLAQRFVEELRQRTSQKSYEQEDATSGPLKFKELVLADIPLTDAEKTFIKANTEASADEDVQDADAEPKLDQLLYAVLKNGGSSDSELEDIKIELETTSSHYRAIPYHASILTGMAFLILLPIS